MLRTARNSIALALLPVALVGTPVARAAPAPLSLDTTFGSGGVVSSGNIPGYEEPAALAVDPSGDVLVAAEGPTGAEGAVVVAQYRPDGVLDTTFGGSGHLVVKGVGPVNALAPVPSGGALLLSRHQVITRITRNGRIDRSFGEEGSVDMARADIDRPSFHIWSLAVLPDGRIVGAGMSFGAPRMVAIRLLHDGSLDTSFGADGSVGVSFGPKPDSGAFAMKLLQMGSSCSGAMPNIVPPLPACSRTARPTPASAATGGCGAPAGCTGKSAPWRCGGTARSSPPRMAGRVRDGDRGRSSFATTARAGSTGTSAASPPRTADTPRRRPRSR